MEFGILPSIRLSFRLKFGSSTTNPINNGQRDRKTMMTSITAMTTATTRTTTTTVAAAARTKTQVTRRIANGTRRPSTTARESILDTNGYGSSKRSTRNVAAKRLLMNSRNDTIFYDMFLIKYQPLNLPKYMQNHHLSSLSSTSSSSQFSAKTRWYSSSAFPNNNISNGNDTPSSSSSSSGSKKRKQKKNKKNHHQQGKEFLERIRQGTIEKQLIGQQAEALFLKFVSAPYNRPSDGPLAVQILQEVITLVKDSDDHNKKDTMIKHSINDDSKNNFDNIKNWDWQERNLPRIFSLVCQVLSQCGHRNAFNDLFRIIGNELLRFPNLYLVQTHDKVHDKDNDLAYNTHHVNDALSQIFKLAVSESKRQYQQHQKHMTGSDNNMSSGNIHGDQRRQIPYEVRQKLRTLKQRAEELYDDPNVPLVGNAEAYNSFIVYHCHNQEPQKARRLLEWMTNEHRLQNQQKKHEDDHEEVTRNTTIRPKLHTKLVAATSLVPKISSFTNIIDSYAKLGQPEDALEFLQWMLTNQSHGDGKRTTSRDGIDGITTTINNENDDTIDEQCFPPPNSSCFNALLDAWARSGRKDAGEKATQTLEWMKEVSMLEEFVIVEELSYAITLNAWARCSMYDYPHSPIQAERLLQELLELYQNGTIAEPPSEASFSSVMNAWASSSSSGGGDGDGDDNHDKFPTKLWKDERQVGPQKVLQWFQVMKDIAADTENLELSTIPYAILIKAWSSASFGKQVLVLQKKKNAHSRQYNNNHNNNKSRQQQQRMIREYEEWNLYCSDQVLSVLSQMREDGIEPDVGIHNAIIAALLSGSPSNAVLYFLSLELEYRNLLFALKGTQEHEKGSGLHRPEKRTISDGHDDSANGHDYDGISDDHSNDVKNIDIPSTRRRLNFTMNTRTFNSGLNALSALNKPDAAQRALDVLQRMYVYNNACKSLKLRGVEPDEITLNIILKVLSRSSWKDAAQKADDLLYDMQTSMPHISLTGHNSVPSFLPCIIAWGRSPKHSIKLERVRDLLVRFQDLQTARGNKHINKASINVYNAALSVCCHNTSIQAFRHGNQGSAAVATTLRYNENDAASNYHSDIDQQQEEEDMALDPKFLPREALLTTLFVMEKLRKLQNKIQPDTITYVNYFKVFCHLRQDLLQTLQQQQQQQQQGGESMMEVADTMKIYDSHVQTELENCIQQALVSPEIVRLVHQASPKTFERFFVDTTADATTVVGSSPNINDDEDHPLQPERTSLRPEEVTIPKAWSRRSSTSRRGGKST